MAVTAVRRDRQARSSLERVHATRRDKARPALCQTSAGNLGRAGRQNQTALTSSLPMSWLRSLIIASRHRKDALETAGVSARAGVHTVPDRPFHVPGVMFKFTFMCMCLCLSILMGSCRVMSTEVNGPAINPRWDGMSIGMHCAAVSTHLRQDGIGRKTSESIIHQQQAFQPAPALSSSDLARPRSDHATSNLGNGSFGTQGQSYAFCPPQPTWGRLVDKTHPARPLPSTMTSSFPPRRSRGPN